MKQMIKIFLMINLFLCGCSAQNIEKTQNKKIVVTIFPIYDWVMNITGDNRENFDITLLMDQGSDLHNFQPSAKDIITIKNSDLFIYVGGESDEWLEDIVRELPETTQVVCLMDVLSSRMKEEEFKEGMTAEEEEEEQAYDEHVWLSLTNANLSCEAIAEAIKNMDDANGDVYQKNLETYTEQLDLLDRQYREIVDSGTKNTLIFGDRFPFLYMVSDYGLDYYAAFQGCSAETEASFETVRFLAEKMDELDMHYILAIDGSDQKIAGTIIENTVNKNAEILVMESMQFVTADDQVSYIDCMKENKKVLEKVLK